MQISQDGMVNCLGWCNKKFWSPDKSKIRFCPMCTGKKQHEEINASKVYKTYHREGALAE